MAGEETTAPIALIELIAASEVTELKERPKRKALRITKPRALRATKSHVATEHAMPEAVHALRKAIEPQMCATKTAQCATMRQTMGTQNAVPASPIKHVRLGVNAVSVATRVVRGATAEDLIAHPVPMKHPT